MRGVLVLVSVVAMTVMIVAAQQPPTDADLAAIDEAVAGVAGVAQVFSVEALPDENAVMISYETREMDEIGYLAEIMDVYRAIVGAFDSDTLAFETLVIVPHAVIGGDAEPIEQVTVEADDALALMRGEITRGEFLTRLVRAPGDHGAGQQSEGEI